MSGVFGAVLSTVGSFTDSLHSLTFPALSLTLTITVFGVLSVKVTEFSLCHVVPPSKLYSATPESSSFAETETVTG